MVGHSTVSNQAFEIAFTFTNNAVEKEVLDLTVYTS